MPVILPLHLLPNKHETMTQCCRNVGPASQTVAQHYSNIGSSCRVCLVGEENHWYQDIILFSGECVCFLTAEKKSKLAEAEVRAVARRAREEHRRSLQMFRTEAKTLGAVMHRFNTISGHQSENKPAVPKYAKSALSLQYNLPILCKLYPSKHESLNQCWVNAGPTS